MSDGAHRNNLVTAYWAAKDISNLTRILRHVQLKKSIPAIYLHEARDVAKSLQSETEQ